VNAVPQELRETVEMLKGVYADPSSKQSMDVADIAKTFGLSSGFQPYNLAPYAVILQPVFSPIRNRLARLKGQGKMAEFKAVTSVDTSGATGVAAEGSVASTIATQFADVQISFASYGLASDPVTYEQLWAGQGKAGDFDIDSRALSVANLLKALMNAEEKLIMFGLGPASQITTSGGDSWTFGGLVGTPSSPTLTAGTSGTMTGTVYVKQTVVTGMGESLPSTAASNAFGTASNGSLAITPVAPSNKPVLGYNIYLSTDNVTYHKYTPATAQANGYSTNGAPITVTAVPGSGAAPPTVDTSGSSNAFNGIWSYMFAGGSGATLSAQNAQLTSLTPLDSLFESIWNAAFGDPDDIWCNSHEIRTLTNLTVGSGNPYYLQYAPAQQSDVIGRYRISRYTNQVTGKVLPISVHAWLPQGSILTTSTQLPAWYVGNNVPSVWAMELTQDYVEIDYEPTRTAPTWQSEIRCFGGLKCHVPSVNGLLYAITP